MKRVFLLDYENTAVRGLYGISELGFGDKVVIFCSNENIRLSLYDMLKIYEERRVEIRVHLLKKRAINALDFMITTYLGFEVSMETEKEIFVISADKGYESAIDMAHELSNGIFIGFHESIYECIHERYQQSLPQKDDEVLTIEGEATLVLDNTPIQKLAGKQLKALSGPVAENMESSDYTQVDEKKVLNRKNDSKKVAPTQPQGKQRAKGTATAKQRSEYRKGFMARMKKDGLVPEQYIDQLTAFMDKSRLAIEFRDKAIVALGNKNKEILGTAVRYFMEYDKERP